MFVRVCVRVLVTKGIFWLYMCESPLVCTDIYVIKSMWRHMRLKKKLRVKRIKNTHTNTHTHKTRAQTHVHAHVHLHAPAPAPVPSPAPSLTPKEDITCVNHLTLTRAGGLVRRIRGEGRQLQSWRYAPQSSLPPPSGRGEKNRQLSNMTRKYMRLDWSEPHLLGSSVV